MRKAARATLLAGLAVLHGCGPTIAKPQLHPVENADLLGVKPRALKVHMLTGELVVLESWRLTTDRLALQGTGTRYTVAREPRDSGRLSVLVAEVALLETNDRERVSSLATAGLSALTVFWGTLSVICGIDPKACFGSCPTFYLEDDQGHPRAEGFSSSIARALEARDLDALGEVHPRRGHLSILMKNEALETHAVRRVRLLAIEKPAGARVFATAAGQFRAVTSLAAPTECRGPEGDCADPLARDDDRERKSASDASDLATREELELFFPAAPASGGLVIRARQSLLTTFLFYQTMAYAGKGAGAWLAALERGGPEQAAQMTGMARVLGGIEVDTAEAGGPWSRVGSFDEAGPIAGDTQTVALGDRARPGPLRVRLRMAKGHWRIGWVALGALGPPLRAHVIEPAAVEHGGRQDERALHTLREGRSHLITLPGQEYRLTFAMPGGATTTELFLESEGYYYEWMREEWMREEDAAMVALIANRPDEALRRLAGPFKAHEARAEEAFWGSRYGRGER